MIIKYLIIAGIISLFFRSLAKTKRAHSNPENQKNNSDTIDAEYSVLED